MFGSTKTSEPSSSSASVILENSGFLAQDAIDLMARQLERTGSARDYSTPDPGGLALEVVGESFLKHLIQPLSLSCRNRARLPQ